MKEKDLIKGLLLLGLGTVGVSIAALNKDKISGIMNELFKHMEKSGTEADNTVDELIKKYKEASHKVSQRIEEHARKIVSEVQDKQSEVKEMLVTLVNAYSENRKKFEEKIDDLMNRISHKSGHEKHEIEQKIRKLIAEYEEIKSEYEEAIEEVAKRIYNKLHIATTDDVKELDKRLRLIEQTKFNAHTSYGTED